MASFQQTHTRFCEQYAQGTESRLQHALCAAMHDHAFDATMQNPDTPLADRQRMTSCAGRNAGAWLAAKPSCRQLTLSNSDYRICARLRIGLPPLPRLPARCRCGQAVAGVYSTHFLACRHDSIVRLLADLYRKAGAPVRVEHRPFEGKRSTRPGDHSPRGDAIR